MQLSYLLRILGRRPLLAFGAVTFIIVFLLAFIQVASRYALKQYAEDQLERVPWDINVYQNNEAPRAPAMRAQIEAVPGVVETQALYFLRTQFMGTVVESTTTAFIDDELIQAPWVSMLAATSPDLLPPEVRPEAGKAVLMMIGSKAQLGDAFLAVQDASRFELRVRQAAQYSQVFEIPVERTVRMDRGELNNWFLEQTSSPVYIPEFGIVLVIPYVEKFVSDFDSVSRGIKPAGHGHGAEHISPGEYFQEVIHLVRLDRDTLVTAWDLAGTNRRLAAVSQQVRHAAEDNPGGFLIGRPMGMDNTTGVLFERMGATSRIVGLVSLLVALPLLWMAWVLLVNLSSLLLLNERRRFGLLRLRGAPGALLGRAMLISIGMGGLLGGLLGAAVGTFVPLYVYSDGAIPWDLLGEIQDPTLLALFLVIGVGISLYVSRRLVRYVANISPLEASGRVMAEEFHTARVRFGPFAALALALGAAKVVGWVSGWSFVSPDSPIWIQSTDRALDFVAFPLFVYGAIALLVSQRRWLELFLIPTVRLLGGRLAQVALEHMSTRPHRVSGLLLIVALMASLSLYPTVMTAVFDDKIERAAFVQLGNSLQITLNVPDLVPGEQLVAAQDGFAQRYGLVATALAGVQERIDALPEVASSTPVVEGLVEGLYMPGYGLGGVPIYLLDDPAGYLASVYSEESLGENAPFSQLVERLNQGEILLSQPLWNFWERNVGEQMPVGRDVDGNMVKVPVGGAVRFMPGIPVAAVSDRDSFVGARIDYLNRMFHNRAYEVSAATNPAIARLDVLMPRVMLSIAPARGVSLDALRDAVLATLPVAPLQVRELSREKARLGSDMYIYLARQNVQIYLFGGVLMALIGIIAVALSNYAEDRRTLGLLRIRGCGPTEIWNFLTANLVAPSLGGLAFGIAVALLVGYGITNLIWQLRELDTIMRYLPTRLAVEGQSWAVGAVIVVIILAVTLIFSRWVFRRSARESLV